MIGSDVYAEPYGRPVVTYDTDARAVTEWGEDGTPKPGFPRPYTAAEVETEAAAARLAAVEVAREASPCPIYPPDWGIRTDGTDARATTDGINRALATLAARGIREIGLPAGVYLIDAVNEAAGVRRESEHAGIMIPSGITFTMDPATILKVDPNASPDYACISLDRTKHHVTIRGGQILGDRREHDYAGTATHEAGFGISLKGCQDVTIDGVRITDCTGDGIMVCAEGLNTITPYYPATRIMIRGCVVERSRRNNISVTAAELVWVENNDIVDAGVDDGIHDGTAPRLGIDIEGYHDAGVDYEMPLKVTIRGNRFRGNRWGSVMNHNGYQCIIEGNYADNTISYGYGTETVIRGNIVANPADTTHPGIAGNSGGPDITHTVITGNTVVGFHTGIQVTNESVACTGNNVSGFAVVGVEVYKATGSLIVGNSIANGAAQSIGVRCFTATRLLLASNAIHDVGYGISTMDGFPSSGIVASGNTLTAIATQAIRVHAGSGVTDAGNFAP